VKRAHISWLLVLGLCEMGLVGHQTVIGWLWDQ